MITDTRLWARSGTTHWDTVPSVLPGSNGETLVVGEPLELPSPAVSVVRLISAGRIGFLPRWPTVDEALRAIFYTTSTNLRIWDRCSSITVVHPSSWGASRRKILGTAARNIAPDVVLDTIATRAAMVGRDGARHQKIAVIEVSPLSTTASLVGCRGDEAWIEACEHEPTVGSADLTADERSPDRFADLITRLFADGRDADSILVLGVSDPALLERIRTAVVATCPLPLDVRPIAGADLLGPHQESMPSARIERGTESLSPEWFGSLRERAAATKPPRNRRAALLTVAALSAAIAVVAAGIVFAVRRDDAPAVAQPTPVVESTVSAAPPPAPTSHRPTTETFGRLTAQIPVGWHRVGPNDRAADARVVLVPDDGTRQRITVIQNPLTSGSGYEQVAANLDAQLKQRPSGTVTDLRRDVVFGGRPGLAYNELPGDKSQVEWHVTIDRDTQVSLGCQYLEGGRDIAIHVCEQFAAHLVVAS
ncbi:type VII secretion-associated protein [Nocardia sp. NPDC052566]|uniref:type VII secretion-associated protein n=1 Tax=Nocardia sp. NPDC052566 TaxID=3364330 RepID=UPI0037C7B12F